MYSMHVIKTCTSIDVQDSNRNFGTGSFMRIGSTGLTELLHKFYFKIPISNKAKIAHGAVKWSATTKDGFNTEKISKAHTQCVLHTWPNEKRVARVLFGQVMCDVTCCMVKSCCFVISHVNLCTIARLFRRCNMWRRSHWLYVSTCLNLLWVWRAFKPKIMQFKGCFVIRSHWNVCIIFLK